MQKVEFNKIIDIGAVENVQNELAHIIRTQGIEEDEIPIDRLKADKKRYLVYNSKWIWYVKFTPNKSPRAWKLPMTKKWLFLLQK